MEELVALRYDPPTEPTARVKRWKRVKYLLSLVRQHASARAVLSLSAPEEAESITEVALGLPNHPSTPLKREDVADAYARTNPQLCHVAAMHQSVLVACADEADLSIYRWAAVARTSHTVVVLSSDSDFNFLPRPEEVRYTVGYRKWSGGARGRPYVLTDNRSLHAFQPGKPWSKPEEARKAALIVGHDYQPGGLKGLGFWRLQRDSALLAGVSRDA